MVGVMTRKRRAVPRSLHRTDADVRRLRALRDRGKLDLPSLFDDRGLDKLLDAVLDAEPDPNVDPNEESGED
jgi:hypothetical protein